MPGICERIESGGTGYIPRAILGFCQEIGECTGMMEAMPLYEWNTTLRRTGTEAASAAGYARSAAALAPQDNPRELRGDHGSFDYHSSFPA